MQRRICFHSAIFFSSVPRPSVASSPFFSDTLIHSPFTASDSLLTFCSLFKYCLNTSHPSSSLAIGTTMRRVFPLRPSETSLLVTYDNEAFEQDDDEPQLPHGCEEASSSTMMDFGVGLQRRSGTDFFVASAGDESPHRKLLQKFRPSSYPVFTGGALPSPRSPLSLNSFKEDGESTSFNSSEDAHRCATSSSASSSSSSNTSVPRTGPSSTEISSCKNSSPPHVTSCSLHASMSPPLKPLKPLISIPQPPPQPEMAIHAESQWAQPDTSIFADLAINCRLSCGLSSQTSPERPRCESSSSWCFPKTIESLSRWYLTSKSPKSRKGSKVRSCNSPLRYLTACLIAENSANMLGKEKHHSQPSSPAKWSSQLHRSYTPPSHVPSKKSSHGLVRDKCKLQCDEKGVPEVLSELSLQRASGLQSSVAPYLPREQWQSPMKYQFFSSDMVHDYATHIHEVCKSPSFRKVAKAASFHYDSDSALSKRFKPRSFSREMVEKLGKGSNSWFHKLTASSIHADHVSSAESAGEEETCAQSFVALKHEISKLRKEKRDLALDLVAEIKARLSEQEATKGALKCMEAEMEHKVISIEKDNAFAQECLEKELERRKKEWSAKLDKIRVEERRLRGRVSEMAEERVELQKTIALYRSKESSWQSQAKDCESSLRAWMQRSQQNEEEDVQLKQSFADVCNKLSDKEHELDIVSQRSKVLDMENTELQNEFSRLRRAYAEQEMTFEGLWQNLVDIVNSPSECKAQSIRRLHRELMRLAVREQALRNEISALKAELVSLKQNGGPASVEDFQASSLPRWNMICPHNLYCTEESPVVQGKGGRWQANGSTCKGDLDIANKLAWKATSNNLQLREVELSQESLQFQVDDLGRKLCFANQQVRQLEYQLDEREEEVELLQSNLQDREGELKELRNELTWVRTQRDGLRKQAEQMSQEALRLTSEVSELRKVAEKLDDELMLKEGQISILREAYSDSDF